MEKPLVLIHPSEGLGWLEPVLWIWHQHDFPFQHLPTKGFSPAWRFSSSQTALHATCCTKSHMKQSQPQHCSEVNQLLAVLQ